MHILAVIFLGFAASALAQRPPGGSRHKHRPVAETVVVGPAASESAVKPMNVSLTPQLVEAHALPAPIPAAKPVDLPLAHQLVEAPALPALPAPVPAAVPPLVGPNHSLGLVPLPVPLSNASVANLSQPIAPSTPAVQPGQNGSTILSLPNPAAQLLNPLSNSTVIHTEEHGPIVLSGPISGQHHAGVPVESNSGAQGQKGSSILSLPNPAVQLLNPLSNSMVLHTEEHGPIVLSGPISGQHHAGVPVESNSRAQSMQPIVHENSVPGIQSHHPSNFPGLFGSDAPHPHPLIGQQHEGELSGLTGRLHPFVQGPAAHPGPFGGLGGPRPHPGLFHGPPRHFGEHDSSSWSPESSSEEKNDKISRAILQKLIKGSPLKITLQKVEKLTFSQGGKSSGSSSSDSDESGQRHGPHGGGSGISHGRPHHGAFGGPVHHRPHFGGGINHGRPHPPSPTLTTAGPGHVTGFPQDSVTATTVKSVEPEIAPISPLAAVNATTPSSVVDSSTGFSDIGK